MGEPDDEDPRLANTFMPPEGEEGEEDPRLANTFMPHDGDDPAEGEEDPRLANTFMPHDEGEEDPRLANTFMATDEDPKLTETAGVVRLDTGDPRATRVDSVAARQTAQYGQQRSPDETLGGGPISDEVAPDMTFMDDGGGEEADVNDQTFASARLDDQGADMTFMDEGGGGLDGQGADMTFMDEGGGGGGLDGQGADMTFMDAGGGGGQVASEPAPAGALDIPTMLEPQPGGGLDDVESDHTFVSLDSQEGMVSSPSLSGSRSQTQLRTQRFDGKVALTVEDDGLFAGKYKLLGELARGGMGVVYKALHVDLNQIVALKLMLAGSHASDDHRRRFLFEAEASARLKHANIVPVFDVGTVEDNLYFTMAFVKGMELKERKDALTRDQLLDVMIKVTDAISFAHQRGIIHRDLKPANVMMTEGDEPLVMDFGLAKQLDDQEKEDEALEDSELAKTTEGAIMGTPYYMSPEQAQGMTHEIDTRTDTYALGVMLYQLWTKKLPFTARRATEILQKIVNEEPARPRQVDETVPQDMEAIILKSMNKVPDQRYASAAALKEDLLRFKSGDPVSAQRATVGYRLKKWAQKNKQQLIAASIVFTVMLGSIIALGYQAYAESARQAEQVTLAISGAQTDLEELQAPVSALEADVAALLGSSEGELAARAQQLGELSGRRSELVAQLRTAGQPLGPHVDKDLRAGKVQGVADELLRRLEARREELARMGRVHASLEQGTTGLAKLEQALPPALAALGSAARVDPVEFASLKQGIKAARQLLSESKKTEAVTSLGDELDKQRAALDELRQQLQVRVFGALAEAPATSPEAMRAREALRTSDGILAQLDAERARFREEQYAQRLLNSSQAIQAQLASVPKERFEKKKKLRKPSCPQCKQQLERQAPIFKSKEEAQAHFDADHELLSQLPDRAVRTDCVSAAILSRDMIKQAIELRSSPELLAQLPKVNEAYLLSLLWIQAYKLFDVALGEPGAVGAETRARLLETKRRQLDQRIYLRFRLFNKGGVTLNLLRGGFRSKGSNLGAKILAYTSNISMLKKLAKHPLLDDELDEARRTNLEQKEAQLKELKVFYAAERAKKKAAREKAAREKAAREKAAREKAAKDATDSAPR